MIIVADKSIVYITGHMVNFIYECLEPKKNTNSLRKKGIQFQKYNVYLCSKSYHSDENERNKRLEIHSSNNTFVILVYKSSKYKFGNDSCDHNDKNKNNDESIINNNDDDKSIINNDDESIIDNDDDEILMLKVLSIIWMKIKY